MSSRRGHVVVAALSLLGLAGCPQIITGPVIPTPPPPPVETGELEVLVAAPFTADVGAPRTVTLRLAWIGTGPAQAEWELSIVSEAELAADHDDAPAPPVRIFRGTSPLRIPPVEEQVTWDGRDVEGKSVAAGRYRVMVVARAGRMERHAERPIVVGTPPQLPQITQRQKSPPAKVGRPAPAGLPYAIFLGNLHSQSNHSDGGGDPATCAHAEQPRAGVGDPAAAYEFARAKAKLDFLLLSEHSHMYDGDSNSVAPGATPASVQGLFEAGRKIAADYRAQHPGFLSLYGTEFGVVAGGGHVNLFNPSGLVTWERTGAGALLGHYLVERSDYRALYAMMKQQGWVGQFNHPDPDQFAVGTEGMAFDAAGDEVMCLAEIANAPAFSNRTDESESDINLFEAGYNRLLLRGYHVAPASNQDNHCANWGASARNRTGLLLPTGAALDENALLEAVRARRTFATTDKTAAAVLTVDGHIMGERFTKASGPLSIKVLYTSESGEAISTIDLVVGRIGGPKVTPRKLDRQEVTLAAFAEGSWFAFARVRQPDGDTLWTAPVWFTVPASK